MRSSHDKILLNKTTYFKGKYDHLLNVTWHNLICQKNYSDML